MSTATQPDQPYRRPIRSYVLREGRMTRGQRRALDDLMPLFGLAPGQPVSPALLAGFKRTIVEVGFGDGAALAELAEREPETLFIGVEVHGPGVGNLLLQVEERALQNVRVYRHDAVEVLRDCMPVSSIDRLHLFFPDPWHKKRHHKRRILSESFIELVVGRLKPDGVFHFATDWEDYAEQGLERLAANPSLRNLSESGWSERPEWRPITRFEKRGQRLGHGVWDVLMVRTGSE